MRKFYLYIVLTLSFIIPSQGYYKSTIDTVISYHWGEGQNNGQSPEYFPANIFGKPDSTASATIPANDPKQVCSLGLDGEIVVAFKNYEIVDGPGPDFTVFENAFINPVNQKVFAEPGLVSVSEDGFTFIDFPFDSATLKGCAGITPTNGDKDCFNPDVSGGDKFDLATIGLTRAKYIRIRDITRFVLNNPKHNYYDPILSGFDLDAVIGLNLEERHTTDVSDVSSASIKVYNGRLAIFNSGELSSVLIYDLNGNLVSHTEFSIHTDIIFQTGGVYCIVLYCDGKPVLKKVIII